jgi:hypothetical protein
MHKEYNQNAIEEKSIGQFQRQNMKDLTAQGAASGRATLTGSAVTASR